MILADFSLTLRCLARTKAPEILQEKTLSCGFVLVGDTGFEPVTSSV